MHLNIAAVLSLLALASAAAVEHPEMGVMRREALLLERQGANAGRPVTVGNCCAANQSKKEDVCTTAAGKAGLCLPEGAQVNCNGALNCIDKSTVKCSANQLENGRPLCRRIVEDEEEDVDEED